jgi:hypothetical protein
MLGQPANKAGEPNDGGGGGISSNQYGKKNK